MKLGRPHLIGSLLLLAASVVWTFSGSPRSSPSGKGTVARAEPAAAGNGVPPDPSSIAAPPPLDISMPPVWARNPFASAAPMPAATAPAQPAPQPHIPALGAILFPQSGAPSAIIDGRIVGVGDRVAGADVLSIARDAVVLQLPSGEVLRLALRTATARGPAS